MCWVKLEFHGTVRTSILQAVLLDIAPWALIECMMKNTVRGYPLTPVLRIGSAVRTKTVFDRLQSVDERF
jgi:hypothetical protein